MGAFDNYQGPGQGGQQGAGGAFSNYAPPASSYDPDWKPSGNAVWDFLTRPRAKTEDPMSAAADVGMSALDYATFGYGPKYFGGADSARQAHQNLGVMDYPVGAMAYAAGPGKILGPLARMGAGAVVPEAGAGASLLARAAPSIAAGAGEGAAASGLGAAGHDGSAGDIARAATIGGVLGGAGGVFGAQGPKPKAPDVGAPGGTDLTGVPTPPTGMYASKETGYAPLDNLYFDTHSDAINRAQTAIRNVRDPQGKGAPLGIPKEVNSILTDSEGLANPEVTGRTIQQASRDLRATGDWTGHRYADALDNTLRYDTPTAGGQAGDAWAAKQAGDVWHQRINDLQRLTPDDGSLPTPAAIKQTQAYYAPKPGETPGPESQALSAAQSAMKPSFNWWHLRHPAGALLGAGVGAAEDFLNPDEHHSPWLNAGTRAAEGALLFSGLPSLAAARPAQALNAARYAVGTGQPMSTAGGRVGDALMNLIYSRGAGGSY